MCGISGYIGFEQISSCRLNRTLEVMKNRGPDFQKYFKKDDLGLNIYLLHSRLAIIDLDDRSNQPFFYKDIVLVFNGEIYNYQELKNQLIKEGESFSTNSDTEVLAKYYSKIGPDCFDLFEGMWSIAIFDKRKQELILCRDRFGEKPLYYLNTKNGIYFGSEVKFISSLINRKLEINEEYALEYLVSGYKSLYKTQRRFFKEIKEVDASSIISVDRRLSLVKRKYWSLRYRPSTMTREEAVSGVREHLTQSLKLRLRSDVPLSFCLSGGVDSGGLVSLANKICGKVSTFSIIDNDPRYDESINIDSIVKDTGCENIKIHLKNHNSLERLKNLIEYHDAPIYTISYLVHSYISEEISKRDYKVVVSGTGADEILTGYYDHFLLFLSDIKDSENYFQRLEDHKKYIKNLIRNPLLQDENAYIKNPNMREHIYLNQDIFKSFLRKECSFEFVEKNFSKSLLRNRMLNELFYEVVPPILHEDDLNSMLYSIENRSPYLDRNLVEFCYSIPNTLLIQNGFGKYILREALQGVLVDKVRLDRKKKGFNASFGSVFTKKHDFDFMLDNSKIYDFVNKSKIERLLTTKPLKNSYSKFLFNFLCLKIFFENNS